MLQILPFVQQKAKIRRGGVPVVSSREEPLFKLNLATIQVIH
jgi:hypothetical protein